MKLKIYNFHKLISATLIAVLISFDAHAVYNGERSPVSFDGMCESGDFKFDPFSGADNPDIDWQLDNPVCITFISTVGATMLAADIAAAFLCKPTNPIGLTTAPAEAAADAVPPPIPYISPGTLLRIAKHTAKCGKRAAEEASLTATCAAPGGEAACPGVPLATADVARCCPSVGIYIAAVAASVSALAVIYGLAKTTYENARICGNDWQQWVQDQNGKWKRDKGPYRQCIEELFSKGITDHCGSKPTIADRIFDITNQYYREYIFGGQEFEDNGDNACSNPSSWDSAKRTRILGYSTDKQRYYMTGSGVASIYACQRFLSVDVSDPIARESYECCKRRSQNAICIENRAGIGSALGDYEHSFCEMGSRCTIANITFDAYASQQQSDYVCARTYSVCPYNHQLRGGTEIKVMDPNDTTQVRNFCQFMNHCSKLPVLPYVNTSSLEGGYISAACRNMKGDSQNSYAFSSDLIPINTRNFSAPIVQCFKETMENIFLNKAGDTKCNDPDEVPDQSGFCASGYLYKVGEDLPGKSFFLKIQDNLQEIIKLTLTFSVMLFGFMILFAGGKPVTKKELLPYILRIGIVMYFAVGDGWQFGFMKGVIDSSNFLANMTFKVDESKPANQLDGCQFPKYNYADSNQTTKYTNPSYPPGKDYLAVWDTLDCKIARALGFGPEVAVPNLVMMILGGFLTGGLGIVFTVGAFIFAFFLLSLTIRAIHIFLLSITAVVTLLFISPIPIVLMMFNRGRPIFTSWLKQITGFTLQPMILFAYLGILITLFDKVVIGDSVTFSGDGIQAPKDIVCDSAADTSIYCIFKLADIKTLPGLEVIGIGLPALKNMNAAKLQTVIQAAFLMFIFAKFMDQISGFAANLVGGAKLESDWKVSTGDMASKAYSVMKGIQQRGMGAAKKIGGKAARVAGEAFKKVGDRGKAVKRDMGDEGDRTGGAVGGKKIGDIVGGPKDNDEVKGPSDKDKAS